MGEPGEGGAQGGEIAQGGDAGVSPFLQTAGSGGKGEKSGEHPDAESERRRGAADLLSDKVGGGVFVGFPAGVPAGVSAVGRDGAEDDAGGFGGHGEIITEIRIARAALYNWRMSGKIHLVTGGCGFLGHLIVRRLLEKGERVRALDIWVSPDQPGDAEFVNCSVLDRDGVARAMRGVGIVHHNAALVPLTKSGAQFAEVNRDGSRVVAEEAVRAGVDAFAYMSSSAVFGKPPRCPITVDTPLAPFESYGESKLAGERAARETCAAAGMTFIAVRPRTILGRGRLGIFQTLFDWIGEGRKIYVLGNGGNRYQFVHADDLLDCYMLALAREQSGDYNIGAAEFRTLREDLEALIVRANSSSRVVPVPAAPAVFALRALDALGLSPLGPYHYTMYSRDVWFDLSPALALGWKPRHSNIEMFWESYRWFLENRERLAREKAMSPHRSPLREGALGILRRLS